MTSTRARKLTFTVLSTAILMAVVTALIFATPNGAFAAGPERPTDLVATAVDHDTVSLTWSHPDPASVDHYQVLSRKQGSGAGKLTQVATSTTTSFQHDGLEPESTYIYRVKPVNSAGEQGQRSTRAEATTPADETPAPEPDPTPVPDATPAQPQRSDEEKQDNVARSSHQVWSATLTVRDSSGVLGCSNGFTGNFCSVHLTDDDFTHDSTDYAIKTLWVRTNGLLELELDTTLTTASQALTINIDGTAFGFADADTIGNATRRWNNSGLNWTAGDSISLTITGSTTLSSDTTLSDLELEDNSNTDITLNPTFASATTTYTAQVVNSVDEITITPSVNDSNASYEIQNNAGTALTDADSAAGFQVDLSVGANIIKVEVTAEDNSTETYTVTVTRAAAANSAPVFADTTADRSVAENTPSGQNVGNAFTATDSDGDTLTYTLEGTNAASFNIVTTSGAARIRTKSGVTYNHEVKSTYTVVVKADDSNGGTDTITVTITITDVTEAPGRPAPPTVSATSGSTTSLDVSWSPPTNTGPAIDNYDLRYQKTTESNWTNGPQNQTAITAPIGSLDAGTAYRVQVRATSDEGDSQWSTSGTGTTTALATPTVSISADKTSAVFKQEGITYTLTRTGATTAALDVSITLTQTKNFLLATELSKTVTIPAGQTTKTFNVAASSFQLFAAGTPVEAGTLTTEVQDILGYDLGTPSSVAVNIVIGATVRFDMASYSVAEANGTLTVKQIAQTGAGAPQPTSTTSSLLFDSVDGTAENGIDFGFSSVGTSFTSSAFNSNGGVWQAEESFNISITPDDIDEADENFKLRINYQVGHQNTPLVNASGNACDPVAGCEVTVTIVDDDTAGVTVSKSAVTVMEQDTTGDTYTVVLDSQPTATVTITIGGQTAADITASPTPLTFTTTNWATPQTVTVTAGNDTDTASDTHSLTHNAASSDAKYSSISITGVAVTVNDNDTANTAPTFSDSTYSRSIAENTASDQNVGFAFAATDSDGDTLTYTLEGTDAASFNIITPITAAQIRTKSGVTYNYEVKSTYTVVIKADDGNGGTATATVTITLTDVNEPPGTPSAPSVSGTSGSDTSLTINWSAPTNTGPDINSYDLQYRQGNSGSFTNGPQNVNGLTTTIPNLAASTSYQVQVRATNDEGDSPWSPPGTGSTSSPPVTPPGQVFGVNITPSDQTLQVNWTRVTGATGYKVQWKSGGQSYISSRQATISSGSTTSRAISNLQNETEYTIRVIATKTGASDGTPSADAMGTPTAANTVPTAPKDLNATAVGDTRIDLSWDAPSSTGGSTLTGYKIEVSNNGNSWTTRVANTASRTYSHTGLSAGDTRHYRVSAINASGTGPHSNVAKATTGLPTVSIANATTTEGGDIVFVITISPPIEGFLSVGYGTGTDSLPAGSMGAKKDDDYVPHHPAGADVQIGYGQSSVELTFTTVDDDLVEGTEIFGIGLYPSAYEGTEFSYGTRKAIATIRDDENGGQAYQDSVPGDTSTNQSISPGGSVQNRIETVDDADWYRTTLTENHCYKIKVEGSSADETLTLQYPAVHGVYRSDGTHIMNTYENADGLGTTAIGNVKLDTTATYYIAAGLYRFENGGTFRLSLTDLGTSDTSCGAAKPGGPMQISVADATMSESPDQRKYMSFIVTLDRRADKEVRVDYTTMNGTAIAGLDYEATSGTLVFDQGEDSKTVYVPIEYDSNDEDDETLTFVLSKARGADIEDGVATGTIVDYE